MVFGLSFGSGRKKSPQFQSDEALVQLYKESGQPKFLGILFERYTHLTFGVCMKYLKNDADSMDAVMEIFEELHHKLLHHEVTIFKGWLYTVTKNHCLMKLRKEKSEHHSKEVYFQNISSEIMESAYPSHLFDMDDINNKMPLLEQGIQSLKTEQRQCIELLYLQKKSYREVSELTGYSMKKVKSHVQNGKRNLKNYLGEQ